MTETVQMAEMCKNCKFVEELTGRFYRCRRYPPTLHPDNAQMNCGAKYPLVEASQWCGEYKRKETR